MNYSINQAYRDVEQILKRPLNSMDFNTINSLIQNYELPYIQWSLAILKTHNVFSTNYIRNFLFNNYQTYQISKQLLSNAQTTTPPPIVEEKVVEEQSIDENMCTDEGWEGCTKLEQEYWCKLMAHSLYPNEYPEPRKEDYGIR